MTGKDTTATEPYSMAQEIKVAALKNHRDMGAAPGRRPRKWDLEDYKKAYEGLKNKGPETIKVTQAPNAFHWFLFGLALAGGTALFFVPGQEKFAPWVYISALFIIIHGLIDWSE